MSKYRFPSGHGQAVRLAPLEDRAKRPTTRLPEQRRPSPPAEEPKSSRPPRPSYAEIDVVEADLSSDPRREED